LVPEEKQKGENACYRRQNNNDNNNIISTKELNIENSAICTVNSTRRIAAALYEYTLETWLVFGI
jgi:hypothetical protein